MEGITKGDEMNWGGVIFIVIGVVLVLGSGKVAEYNRFIRSQEIAKAEERLKHAQGSKLLAKMQMNFHKSSLEAGKVDHLSIILVGTATIILGIFTLFYPNGW